MLSLCSLWDYILLQNLVSLYIYRKHQDKCCDSKGFSMYMPHRSYLHRTEKLFLPSLLISGTFWSCHIVVSSTRKLKDSFFQEGLLLYCCSQGKGTATSLTVQTNILHFPYCATHTLICTSFQQINYTILHAGSKTGTILTSLKPVSLSDGKWHYTSVETRREIYRFIIFNKELHT